MKTLPDTPAPVGQRQDIELLRLISAFGIVYFHSQAQPGHELAHSALVAFIILSMYLGGKGAPVVDAARKRFSRLMVPWLAWSAIYGAVNYRNSGHVFNARNGFVSDVLAGPSIHLWYLPFIFACLVAIDALRHGFSGKSMALASWLLAALGLLSGPWWRPLNLGMSQPWAQYAYALPCVFFGVFFACQQSLQPMVSGILQGLLLLFALLVYEFEDVGMPYTIGLCAGGVIASKLFAQKITFNFGTLSRYTFGIYLVHGLVLRFVGKIGAGFMVPIWAFMVSAAIVALIHHFSPKTAKILG